jgi:hypothetical protein
MMPALPLSRRRVEDSHNVVFAVAVAVAVAAIGILCGRLAISHYGKAAIEAAVGIPILIAVNRRPLVAMVVLLAVDASAFSYANLPRVNFPGHPPINVADLLLATAVGGTLWRRPWRTWPTPVRRYSLALVLLLLVVGVATIKTALLGYAQSRDALYEYRNWLYLAVALTIALEFSGRLWRTWLNVAIGVAALVSIASIAGAASHSVANTLLTLDPTAVFSPSATTLSGGVTLGGTARIRLEGLYFIYSMVIPTIAVVLVVNDRWRRLRIVALLLIIGAVAVSLNRNMYGGALVGVVVAALLGGPRMRHRLAIAVGATVVILALVVLTSVTPAITTQVGRRLGSALAPSQIEQSGSYQDRAYELSYAFPSIARHPWFGVGPRQFYGAYIPTTHGNEVRFFVQNLYLDLATDYGIPAALAFLLIPGVCLWFGLSRMRFATDPFDKALLAAAIGTLVALLLSGLVDTFVQDPETTVAFGASCGLLLAAALRTVREQPHKDVGLHV